MNSHKRTREASPLPPPPLAAAAPPDPGPGDPASTPSSTASRGASGSAGGPPPAPPGSAGGGGPPSAGGATAAGASATFRNVSACNRCRLRKNRCDQHLPACAACAKARVRCVGYDPILKREIPRAYVYYLESRVAYLEGLLTARGIAFAPAEDFDAGARPLAVGVPGGGGGPGSPGSPEAHERYHTGGTASAVAPDGIVAVADRERGRPPGGPGSGGKSPQEEADNLNKLVSNIGMVSVQGASDPRFLGSTSGISFARVVFAAVRSSISGSTSDRAGLRPGKPLGLGSVGDVGTGSGGGGGGTGPGGPDGASMRDSFFGLQSKPAYRRAPFPSRELGLQLANLYFENANPQIPILHRGEFMALFERTYATEERRRSPRELYLLNMVFAIGAGIILGGPAAGASATGDTMDQADGMKTERPAAGGGTKVKAEPDGAHQHHSKRPKLSSGRQSQPEEYHASAMVHLEYFLGSAPAADRPEGFGASMEELQAVLLLAGFALLRPVAPGLWYIVGVAVRLALDLGLHYEDGVGVDEAPGGGGAGGAGVPARSTEVALDAAGKRRASAAARAIDARERGRREWVRDLRRRLWWCVYSFDRLVSTCVGRPFGVTDQVITTEFPSLLDDRHITTAGLRAPPGAEREPSYKRVAHHYWRLRLLQSEMLQVLQHRQAAAARARGRNRANAYMHTRLPSPFLHGHADFRAWRRDLDRRLWQWKGSAPAQRETGVAFDPQFLELNYWQAVIMLYRQGLSTPVGLRREGAPSDELASPMEGDGWLEDEEDEEEVFVKVAEAGQRVLKIYYQLNRQHIVNYTFLATHHLFMAGELRRNRFCRMALLTVARHCLPLRDMALANRPDETREFRKKAGALLLGTMMLTQAQTYEDVDYTILAAMTVLTNLQDKCPPAEACKDAFDRMAKATVSMCMQTTGFGTRNPVFGGPPTYPGPLGAAAPPPPPPLQPGFALQQQAQPGYFAAPTGAPPTAPVAAPTAFGGRPRPQFDMNMSELFPDDSPDRQSFRSVKWAAGAHPPLLQQPQQQQQQQPSQQMAAGAVTSLQTYAPVRRSVSPGTDPALAATQAPPAGYSTTSFAPTTDSVTSGGDGGGGLPDASYADAAAALDGLDDAAIAAAANVDLDHLLAEAAGAYPGSAGMTLGFDADHDWNDGCGPDLFDGYWFRGGSTAGWGGGGIGGGGGGLAGFDTAGLGLGSVGDGSEDVSMG